MNLHGPSFVLANRHFSKSKRRTRSPSSSAIIDGTHSALVGVRRPLERVLLSRSSSVDWARDRFRSQG